MVNHDSRTTGLGVPPRGKHLFGLVKVGEKGQIVIPARARKIFGIEPGDALAVLGDENRGLALLPEKSLLEMMERFRAAQGTISAGPDGD